MDINKHNRLETYATKAIRYWTSNDIIDWLKTSITTLKIEIPEEDINIYCKRVETEKCDGNCLLACEKLLETRRVSNEEHNNKNYDNALHLFYSNKEVCEHNKAMLAKLDGNTKDFQANLKGYPKGSFPQIKYDTFIEETRFHEYLSLKLGTRVILIHNIDIADS